MMKLLPFLLVFVLLASGCTIPVLNIEVPGLPDIFGGPTVVQYENDIVIINSLEAVPAEVDAGQTTKIIAYITNKGDRAVGNTDDTKGGKVSIELYDYCSGLFTVEQSSSTCRGRAMTSAGFKCEIDKLLPGETVPVVWTLKQQGSIKLKTVCPPDGIKVSVRYPYKTRSLTTISFISQDELQRTLEERTMKSSESYIVAGQGPIKPYITVEDKQPIPVFSGARSVLALQISNKGTGYLVSEVTSSGSGTGATAGTTKTIAIPKDKVEITWPADGMKSVAEDCKFSGSTTSRPSDDVKLIGKDSSKMLCKVDLSDLATKVTKTTTRHMEVSVEYEYMFTKSVLVTVNPKISG